jgi:hypothetical protein
MTPKDVKAMEAARLEWRAAIDALEDAFKQGKSGAEIHQAIKRLNEKQAAYTAFGKKFFTEYLG